MVNVKQYLAGVAVAVSALLNPIESSAYEIKLVKSVYTPHKKVSGGCWYGMGIEDLEYRITFNKTDLADFTKINREVFLTQLAIDINREIQGDRRDPSYSNIISSKMIDNLKEQNPALKTGKLTVTSPLTYKTSRSIGFGLDCKL